MRILLLFVLCLGLSQFSSAEIYQCKGKNGKKIFQQHPCSDNQVGAETDAKKLWQEMRTLVNEGSAIIAQLGADVESIKRCHRKIEIYKKDVAAIAPRVEAIADEHYDMMVAFRNLEDCAYCRTSANSYCRSANRALDKAMRKLMTY